MKHAFVLILAILAHSCICPSSTEVTEVVTETGTQKLDSTNPARPDINCLINDFDEYFKKTEMVFNERVDSVPFNPHVEPLMAYIGMNIADKEVGKSDILTIQEINVFYEIHTDEFFPLRELLKECAQLPNKSALRIIELNYLYCVIVWQNGFTRFSEKLPTDGKYKKAFFNIVETTIPKIFNYNNYIRDIKLTNSVKNFWSSFYVDLKDFRGLNDNSDGYSAAQIVSIKSHNMFYKPEEMRSKNMFFAFYLNLIDLMRALHKSYFFFSMQEDEVMQKIQELSASFENIVVDELYDSLFYLLMRTDEMFVESVEKYFNKEGYLIDQTVFDQLLNRILGYLTKREEEAGELKNMPVVSRKARKAHQLPSDNPLLNTNLNKYKGKLIHKEPVAAIIKEAALPVNIITETNAKIRRFKEQDANLRKFISGIKTLGSSKAPLFSDRRILAARRQTSLRKLTKRLNNNRSKKQKRKLHETEHAEHTEHNEHSEHNEHTEHAEKKIVIKGVAAQPQLNNPEIFFALITKLKRPQIVKDSAMTITAYFKKVERTVRDHYGENVNPELLAICKSHMKSNINQFSNIFCLIFQREINMLVQQKYGNSKVQAFINKYLPFIVYNFMTYFLVIEDKGERIETVAIILYFNEKFFSAIRLAIISMNNLLMHFEEEYRGYYRNQIRNIFMPYLNHFKATLQDGFYDPRFQESTKEAYAPFFVISDDELKIMFLPSLREGLRNLVIIPTLSDMNTVNLRNQYETYLNSMNLVSYNTIKQQFMTRTKAKGVQISSQGPEPACENFQIEDFMKRRGKEIRSQENPSEMKHEEEQACIQNWKLYDDQFYWLFYNEPANQLILKAKLSHPLMSVAERNILNESMENELIRITNFFRAGLMKQDLEHFFGEKKEKLQQCGILEINSERSCHAVFGMKTCQQIPNTVYYTRTCPKDYTYRKPGCVLDCNSFEQFENETESLNDFCELREEDTIGCPPMMPMQDKKRCLKPTPYYYPFIMNPFNNKLP